MAVREYLETKPVEPLVPFSSNDTSGVSFVGSIRHHPYDEKKVILVSFSETRESTFFEFKLSDIVHIEARPQIVSEDGDSLQTVEIFVRKGSFGIAMKPFTVGMNDENPIDTKGSNR